MVLWAMLNPIENLKGRGNLASLAGFALIVAGWAALHVFGPHINPGQDRAVFVAVLIALGTFTGGALLALLHLLLKAVVRR